MEARIDFLTAVGGEGPAQLAQLLALEWLLGTGLPDKLKEAPLAIKVLYDEDIAEEVCTMILYPTVLYPATVPCQEALAWFLHSALGLTGASPRPLVGHPPW